MRGGFVACLTASKLPTTRLEAALSGLRWRAGEPSFHRHGGFQVACLVDDAHGPEVEIRAGKLLLAHGAPVESLDLLEQRDRFVGVGSDGLGLSAIRDPMGEVPLFYRRVGDEFWLATEIHPLLTVAPAEPDLDWLAAFAAMAEYPDTTGWLGVKRVLPGEILMVDRELRVSSRRYFLPIVGNGGPRSPATAALRVRELLALAVAERVGRHCGVLLSGGLDSSAVALVAAQTTSPTLLTISHPMLPQIDERSYARAVADATGIPLAVLELEPEPWDPVDDIETFGAPPLVAPVGMYGRGLQALVERGCDVALDGHDGDGVLGNMYAWEANTLLDGRLDRLAGAVRQDGPGLILRETVKGLVSSSLLSRVRGQTVSPGYPASLLPYFRGKTASRLGAESRWRSPRAGWEQMQMQALQPPTTQFFEEFELLGARFGIDVQHPFADRDLIGFAIGLPHAVKASRVQLKPLLRDALADLFPPIVAEREDKTPFTAVLDARVDFDACYRWVRDSGVRLPDIDYGRLFRDAAKPVNDRIFWTRLASAHVFLAGA